MSEQPMPTKQQGGGLDPGTFVAYRDPTDGWCVLAPWSLTLDGHWWRPHWTPQGSPSRWSDEGRIEAEHYARQLNKTLAANNLQLSPRLRAVLRAAVQYFETAPFTERRNVAYSHVVDAIRALTPAERAWCEGGWE